MTSNDYIYFIQKYLDTHSYIVPLGIVGVWRWTVWTCKELVGLFYRPKKQLYNASVSIVTPVYNENPHLFFQALQSWEKNNPLEIIAVIDYTDEKCIAVFQQFAKERKNARLIVTHTPGKREALADGIKSTQGEIVALVDSDTLWADGVIKNGLPPFHDSKVAGVGTYQNVLHPQTLTQKIFDAQLDLRYSDEFAFLAASGDALICLSGRTAFYRRAVIVPLLPDLVHETFFGQKVVSGDDKRLTYLVLSHGWKVAYQSTSKVYTPGMGDFPTFMKQRIRWARNSLRADIKALLEGWPIRHPSLMFFQIDKFLQSIVVILSPIYFVVALLTGLYSAAALIFLWWFVSRSIKMFPHLKRRPQDIFILPVFILYTFLTGLFKIYAFFTLNTQGWITRWDASRLPKTNILKTVRAYALSLAIVILLGFGVYFYKQQTYFIPLQKQNALIAVTLPVSKILAQVDASQQSDKKFVNQKDLSVRKHIVKAGESLGTIADAYDVPIEKLLFSNIPRLPNWNTIEPGLIVNIPGKDAQIAPDTKFNYQRIYPDPFRVVYDQSTNTINVYGRGEKVNLTRLKNSVDEGLIQEVEPKVWHTTASIFIRSGVTLVLDKDEVKWLRLASNEKKFAILRAYNATILVDGVKITSWDEVKKFYDTDLKDGRSFILVKDNSRMDFINSELAYLGYPRTPKMTLSPYGVSWRMSNGKLGKALLTGEVIKSKFHHNYFGAYTFGATGMTWRGNEFYENIRYGLDPHDDSNGFLVENNIFHHNGSHGIIFSKRCVNNIIRNNFSYDNKLHGIMLHESSNNNIIENNIVSGNTDGIAIWHSSNNIIRSNKIENNKNGVRANALSVDNRIVHNVIRNSKKYGVYLYLKADNTVVDTNTLIGNDTALYIKTNNNTIQNNRVEDNRIGVYFINFASHNIVSNNQILYNKQYGIYTKIMNRSQNILGENYLYRNRYDVVAKEIEGRKLSRLEM